MALLLTATYSFAQISEQNRSDGETLNKAVDYFQSGKYHESLLMFKKLENRYHLNKRFVAYMGVCYFYDEDYKKCANTIDSIASELDVFAPHERSVYFYCTAESFYRQCMYTKATEYFEKVLLLCYNKEKSDILKRIGQCYWQRGAIENAQEYFLSAKQYNVYFNGEDQLSHFLYDPQKWQNNIK